MYTSKNVPIIIPCFNRPEFLEQCLDHLKNCDLIEQFEIFFSFDNKELDSKESKQVLRLCEKWEYSPRTICFRENIWHGSLNSTGAICHVMKRISNPNGFIYIEEDINVSRCFLRFCLDALNFYHDNKYVMMATGSNINEKENPKLPNTAKLDGICTCSILWGIASWWNRWLWIDENLEYFCEDPSSIKEDLFNKTILPEINCHLRDDGTMRNYAGGGLITASMLINGSLCLYPDYSLTDHSGWYGWHIPKDAECSSKDKPFGAANTFHKDNDYNKNFPLITKKNVADSFSVNIDGIKE